MQRTERCSAVDLIAAFYTSPMGTSYVCGVAFLKDCGDDCGCRLRVTMQTATCSQLPACPTKRSAGSISCSVTSRRLPRSLYEDVFVSLFPSSLTLVMLAQIFDMRAFHLLPQVDFWFRKRECLNRGKPNTSFC